MEAWSGPEGATGFRQVVASLMPPHATHIETHLVGGAIMKRKPRALRSIGIDLGARAIRTFRCSRGLWTDPQGQGAIGTISASNIAPGRSARSDGIRAAGQSAVRLGDEQLQRDKLENHRTIPEMTLRTTRCVAYDPGTEGAPFRRSAQWSARLVQWSSVVYHTNCSRLLRGVEGGSAWFAIVSARENLMGDESRVRVAALGNTFRGKVNTAASLASREDASAT